MVAKTRLDRAAALEQHAGQRRHQSVIACDDVNDRDAVAAILLRLERAGRLSPDHGVLLVPAADLTLDEWEATAVAPAPMADRDADADPEPATSDDAPRPRSPWQREHPPT